MKKLRSFTDLSLKEAIALVEKTQSDMLTENQCYFYVIDLKVFYVQLIASAVSTSISTSLIVSIFLLLQLFHSDDPTKHPFFGGDSTQHEPTRKPLKCNALFSLGVPRLVVFAGVAALLFGPKKLPEIGKSIGKTSTSFQQAAKEFESELKTEPEDSATNSSLVAMSNKEVEKKTEVSSSSEENV
ncbi:unnamed protein product [Arabidopsis halleri]